MINQFCILYPKNYQTLSYLDKITGIGIPYSNITLLIDNSIKLSTTVDCKGCWEIILQQPLNNGCYTIEAIQYYKELQSCCTVEFCIKQKLITPSIVTPVNGSIIDSNKPIISGVANPGNVVTVCIENIGCINTIANNNGVYAVQFNTVLPNGTYTINVTQQDIFGNVSSTSTTTFTVLTTFVSIQPISVVMGSTFRTLEINFDIYGFPSPATIYYLMLPPGSPTPTPDEIINYPYPNNLLNGTVARGQFNIDITLQSTNITSLISGREVPNPIIGETGAIDGYVYDVYIYAVLTNSINSGVIKFSTSAMAMPFANGDGTVNTPYEIRDLTPTELLNYPDLLAGNPNNKSGVDENARMISNIERLEVLYDETNGLYGMTNSLSLNYILTSSIDLSNYINAYNKNGWIPIGNYDGSHFNVGPTGRHIFKGTLDGQNNTISNLYVTPKYTSDNWVEYVGFIGYAANATISNINLNTASISPIPYNNTRYLRTGAFIGAAQNCNINNINLNNIKMSFGSFGDSSTLLYAGGMIGIFYGGNIAGNDINSTADNIEINTNVVANSYCGGIVGYLQNLVSSSIKNYNVNSFKVSNPSTSELDCGAVIGCLNALDTFNLENININGVNINIQNSTSGGAIGYINASKNVSIKQILAQNLNISTTIYQAFIGGIVGEVYAYSKVTISDINVESSSLSSSFGSGGIIGYLFTTDGAQVEIYNFSISNPSSLSPVNISAINENTGGVIGYILRDSSSSLYLHDGNVYQPTNITTTYFNCGGFIGSISTSNNSTFTFIQNCSCNAKIKITAPASSFIGGLIGQGQYIAINKCSFEGSILGANNAGGLVGSGNGIYIGYSTSNALITGSENVGGLIGIAESANITPTQNPPFITQDNVIELSNSKGSISAQSGNNLGGLIGSIFGIGIDQCFSSTNISQNLGSNIGMLIGNDDNDSDIINSYAVGSSTNPNTSTNIGGIVGSNDASIKYCYSSSDVSGNNYIAGIAGQHNNNIINSSFALGNLVYASDVDSGRIVGYLSGTLENNYAIDTLQLYKNGAIATPVSDPNGTDGQSIALANLQSTMISNGWSTTIWNFDSIATLARPTLINNPE